ncbi:MAG TPA: adenosylcobinamide-phosphate synthase CbiB [Vicinamibacterales bacterium]|nr:adenosylcobinamide-phosphate synthase CbiB [Vicinamibacterales bacterium]
MTAVTLGCAYVADLLCGDPEWFPHPVRLIGRLTATGEALAQPGLGSVRRDLVAGTVLSLIVVAATVASTVVVIVAARWLHPSLGFAAEVILAWTALATGSLLAEARQVLRALDDDDLVRARQRVARIVGRDTTTLHEPDVSRALIETLAESTCDGIVAPLCYLAVGGLPAAMAYKAINTLDSMIGHREPPYTYFGRCAARLDDVANFVPARLAALAIVLAAAVTGGHAGGALRGWWRDHDQHDSPNAGHPEAAMAGALGITLGGVNLYDGVPHQKPLMGAGAAPATRESAHRASRVVLIASMISGAAAVIARALASGR